MDSLADHLPASLRDIVRLTDIETAIIIVHERGGTRLYIPTRERANADHWLARLIGADAFMALVDYYDGEEIEVPRCVEALQAAREREILQQAEAGASQAELARRHRYTERGIRKLLKRARAAHTTNQLTLPL